MKSDVKERIETCAMKMFLEYGIKAVTMDVLASRMGISKRTIYELFSDKDQLLIECIEYHKEKTDKRLKTFVDKCQNAIEIFYYYIQYGISSNLATGMRMVDDTRKYHPKVYQLVVQKHEEERTRKMINLLDRGIKEKLFRADFSRDVMAALLHQQMDALFLPSNPLHSRFSLEMLYEAGLMTFVRGICTEAGIKELDRLTKETKEKEENHRESDSRSK